MVDYYKEDDLKFWKYNFQQIELKSMLSYFWQWYHTRACVKCKKKKMVEKIYGYNGV